MLFDFQVIDIVTGDIDSSNFLLGLCAVSSVPGRARGLFAAYDNSAGVYGTRFFRGGSWIPIVVDGLVAVHGDDSPAFAAFRHEKFAWISLMEKAYAKLYGSYAAIAVCDYQMLHTPHALVVF